MSEAPADATLERSVITETSLTNQEKRNILKPETLANLATDEYIALWKRLNPYFLTHVTRQGFRDHYSTIAHAEGVGTFQNGLLDIINDDRKLRTPFGVAGLIGSDEASLKIFLSKSILRSSNKEQAHADFNDFLHHQWGTAPKYPDKSAVHFAAEVVADRLYGGETGNEVFFCFPSDVLASQLNFGFGSGLKDFTNPNNDITWNDVWMWPKSIDDPGISIDAGLVFIPRNTLVDSETGSTYASQIKIIDGVETRVMVEDEELIKNFDEWTNKLSTNSEIVKVAIEYGRERGYIERQEIKQKLLSIGRTELGVLGFSSDQIEDVILDLVYRLSMWKTQEYLDPKNENRDKIYGKMIRESFARFKRPSNLVSAKIYWEKYFSEHPDKKPKHIIYYDGNPTEAIHNFLIENKIDKAYLPENEGLLLGFDDHHVVDVVNDPRSNQGHEKIVNLGNKIIEEYFKDKI